ncbi:response regulator [Oceanobacillus sp. 143]|uniref:DNA-binding response regulator n=1 Tax=Oceanobacillus zhaokaii TaxID=2052660 RepID=A0A345PJT9_9BACI|nr:LytTR family transcriptional regulator DNA-binding domain-containing protein [Oceanobacillus zhaokaii]AXI10269.1 DNA-binding response regulator [Oceanobacillus zhaokaii]QGS69332.1 response regulator [Oceanobacillus sp. 143]
MKIHVMIAEDEQLAREELIYLLEKEEDVSLCPSAENGEQLVKLYVEHEPEVIFLDVHMPGMHGLEAAKKITELAFIKPPLFIFTTAYDEYAIEAFSIEAIDYMLKPYDTARFQMAMQRARKRLQQLEMKQNNSPDISSANPIKLLIDDNDRMVVLSPDSIYYAVPYNRMLEIHTEDRVIISRMTLQELEKKVQGYSFFRTHRSYLVNLNHIQDITPWFNGTSNVTLNNKEQTTIPVSRAARKHLFDLFEK